MDRRDFFAVFAGFATALGLDKIVPGDKTRHLIGQGPTYVSKAVANGEPDRAYTDAMMDPPPDRSGRDLSDPDIPAARYTRIHGISQTKDLKRGAEPEFEAVFGGHPLDWDGPVTAKDRIAENPTFDEPGPALFSYKRRGLKIDGSCNPAFIEALQGIHERADTIADFRRRAERYILSFCDDQLDRAVAVHL